MKEQTPIEELIIELENEIESIKQTKFRPEHYHDRVRSLILKKLKSRYLDKEKAREAQHKAELKEAVIEAYSCCYVIREEVNNSATGLDLTVGRIEAEQYYESKHETE